jgi:hypothetical protein
MHLGSIKQYAKNKCYIPKYIDLEDINIEILPTDIVEIPDGEMFVIAEQDGEEYIIFQEEIYIPKGE